jgi:hypothetical protein
MTQPMQFPDPAGGYPPDGGPVPDGPVPDGYLPGAALVPDAGRAAAGWRRALVTSLAVLVGTAVLGVAGGFLWAAVAPRAAFVMVGNGVANVVNSETNAFIAADGWYCLICLLGGVITGLLGYWLAVRRHGPVAMAAMLIGALAAGLITLWIGEQSGLSTFHHLLATLPSGAHFQTQLVLGSRSAIAFWPLAAGLMAGSLELSAALRDRRQDQEQEQAQEQAQGEAASVLPAGRGYPGAMPRFPGRHSARGTDS